MTITTTQCNSKNVWLTNAIIETEQLDLNWSTCENALGDTVIAVSGNKEDIETFLEVFTMVGGE